MKALIRFMLVLLFGWVMASAVAAAEGPTVNPTQLTIAGARGAVETRTFYLRAAAPITGVRSVALDLLHTDNTRVLPASAVRVTLPAHALAAGELLTATLTVDLRQMPAGAYSGQVLFLSADAAPIPLALTVHVRHLWGWPAAVTILGVVLGLFIPWYQAHGQARDALFIRLGRLTQALANDAAFEEHFGAQVKPLLQQVQSALTQNETALADAALKAAEALLKQWLAGREDWIAQLRYLRETLLPQWTPHAEEAQTVRELLAQARALLARPAGAPDKARDPQGLQQEIVTLERAWERYRQLHAQLQEILESRFHLPEAEEEAMHTQLLQLQERLQQLSLEDDAAWEALKTNIEALGRTLLEKIETAPPDQLKAGDVKSPRPRGFNGARLRQLLGMPEAAPAAPPIVAAYGAAYGAASADTKTQTRRMIRWAAARHTFFSLLLYFLTGLFLAGLGFNNLYLDNPSFGAQPVLNYLTLLAWGLGAETSVTSIAGLLKKWDLPASVPGVG